MDDEQQDGPRPVAIPDDALVVRQSSWAVIWPAVPWIAFFGVSVAFDFFPFGVLPAVLATIVIGSRYLSFRRTAYILTESDVIIQQGTVLGQQRVDLPFADLKDILVQPGTFGKSLGYTRVNLQLNDGRRALLNYVPLTSPLFEHLRARISPQAPLEEEPGEEL